MRAILLLVLVPSITLADIYVSVSGDDSASCATTATACRTIDAALARIPKYWGQRARIVLGPGSFTISDLNIQAALPGPGAPPLVIQGNSMEDSGLGVRTVASVVATSIGRVYQVTDNSLSLTEDQYLGWFIRFTSGVLNGQTRMVRHTLGGLVEMNRPDGGFTVQVGDHFVIERPASIIMYSGNLRFGGTSGHASKYVEGVGSVGLILHRLRLIRAGEGTIYVSPGGIWMTTISIDLGSGSLHVLPGASLAAGEYTTTSGLTDIVGSVANAGAGVFLNGSSGGGIQVYLDNHATLYGYIVAFGLSFDTYGSNLIHLKAPIIKGGAIMTRAQGTIWIVKDQELAGKIIDAPNSGILLAGFSIGYIDKIDISGSSVCGITAQEHSEAYLLGAVTGTGNVTAGICVQSGGDYRISGVSNPGITVTGTAFGEVRVGSHSTTHDVIGSGTAIVDDLGGMARNSAPTDRTLYVNKLVLVPVVARPSCEAGTRGMLFPTSGSAGVSDKLEICQKAANDAYSWATIGVTP